MFTPAICSLTSFSYLIGLVMLAPLIPHFVAQNLLMLTSLSKQLCLQCVCCHFTFIVNCPVIYYDYYVGLSHVHFTHAQNCISNQSVIFFVASCVFHMCISYLIFPHFIVKPKCLMLLWQSAFWIQVLSVLFISLTFTAHQILSLTGINLQRQSIIVSCAAGEVY